jgi:hypothetical protein
MEPPVFRADDDGAKAKALYEMTQTEGWQHVREKFFEFGMEPNSAREKAEREVRRTAPREGTRDYWAGKLDMCVFIPDWIGKTVKNGTKKEETNGR